MPITHRPFGTHANQAIEQYEIVNDNDVRIKLMTYGATITSISVPDGRGGRRELAAGFDTLEGYFGEAYLANAPYFGCTVGRYASRIKDGKFTLDGKEYTLAVNDGSNHLHGGRTGFDKRVWKAVRNGDQSVRMILRSPDGEEGYPGNLEITVDFTLTDDNKIVIEYEGKTDAPTPLSLTNHTYFNLSGFRDTIAGTRVQIKARTLLEPDETNIPVGETSEVDGTVADFRKTGLLGNRLEKMDTGFEHYYSFGGMTEAPRHVASFEDVDSGTKLDVRTTEPGALFYTGYFTSDDLRRENGDQFGRYRAFCFETSRYPNGPNLGEANSILRPGKTYRSTTVYELSF